MALSFLGLTFALAGACVTAESVAAKVGRAQIVAAEARTAAEDEAARGNRAAVVANAAAALRALRDAHAWVDAYVTAHGRGTPAQFESSLRRIAADADAAGAAALKAGATLQSIEAEISRQQSRVQAGAAGGGGGAGGGGM